MPRFRIESDAHGDCKVPAEAYFGARTQRALASGPSCGQRMGGRFTWAMGLIKRSCCEANEVLGTLDVARAELDAKRAAEAQAFKSKELALAYLAAARAGEARAKAEMERLRRRAAKLKAMTGA